MLSQSTHLNNVFTFNGCIVESNDFPSINRALLYGDGIFDTILVLNFKIIFGEDHYFRLLKGMRMLKMEIPFFFTQDFWENEINKLLIKKKLTNSRVRTTIIRKSNGLYLPKLNSVDIIIQAENYNDSIRSDISIGVYKEQTVNQTSLSNIKTTNRLINVLASIFASENKFDNAILLNHHKRVVSTANGNIFIIKKNIIRTPSLVEGSLDGIIRKKIISDLIKLSEYKVEETELNLYDLLQADEIFYSNSIIGVQGVYSYKNRNYATEQSSKIDKIIKSIY